jgi:hypothetical protein
MWDYCNRKEDQHMDSTSNSRILYLEAGKRDFSEFMRSHPGYFRRPSDGRIDFKKKMMEDVPWLYVKGGRSQNCILWHKIMFNEIHKQLKVPIPCQNCWKVVIMPRNLEELLATWLLQQQMGRPSKCGTEGDRSNTDRLYGGYWYTNSLDEGLECFHAVCAQLANQQTYRREFLGVPLACSFGNQFLPADAAELPTLILKRGCTEMEQHCGPSDAWSYDEAQKETEAIVTDAFAADIVGLHQSENHIASILKTYIHKAFQWGDPSYVQFTNGNRLFSPPVTYHDKDQKFITQVREQTFEPMR